MSQFPDFATFTATIADSRFLLAVGVVALSGIVRGFSGFGSALIYVPLIAAIYNPHIATVSFILIDYVCVAPFAVRIFPQCQWREILPAFAAALVTVPLGTMTQQAVDPVILRWGMSALVLAFVVVLASGWRLKSKPSPVGGIIAGGLSGYCGGATQMSGPPVILYWLGSPGVAATVRANLLVFLVLVGAALTLNYVIQGMVTRDVLALAIALWPAFVLSLVIGSRAFHGASDQLYRKLAYLIVAAAALVSLPVFDSLLR